MSVSLNSIAWFLNCAHKNIRQKVLPNSYYTINTPTKWSNAQRLVEKGLLFEENKKTGNVMQQPMDSYVCGIKYELWKYSH